MKSIHWLDAVQTTISTYSNITSSLHKSFILRKDSRTKIVPYLKHLLMQKTFCSNLVIETLLQLIASVFSGLLTSTLFTFRDHACENEKLKIRCPYGTTVSIQAANFGRRVPSNKMCSFGRMFWPSLPRHGDQGSNSSVELEDVNCVTNNSLKVSGSSQGHCQ